MYERPKLTFVSFFYVFFLHLPLTSMRWITLLADYSFVYILSGIDQVNFSSLFSNKMFHVAGAKIICCLV